MRINNCNPIVQIKEQNFTSKPNIQYNKGLDSDVFQKTNVSFKGDSGGNFFDALINRAIDFIQEKTMEIFDNFFEDMIEHAGRESDVELYLDCFNNKKIRRLLLQNKNEKLQNLNTCLLDDDLDIEYINSLLEKAKIKNVIGLENFTRIFNKTPETKRAFDGQNIEALEIYGLLKSKDDLSKYAELLLYLYNESEDEDEEKQAEKLNGTTDFLRTIGLSEFKDFDEKFAHLKSSFNNFEDFSDKADAVKYLQTTYDQKIALIEKSLKGNPALKTINPVKIYATSTDLIDVYYAKNNGQNLNGIDEILEIIVQEGKFKQNALKQVAPHFNDFKTIEDKVQFYQFLKSKNITVNDFNQAANKTFISDIDVIEQIENKDFFLSYLSDTFGMKNTDSETYYKNFKDALNAIYDKENDNIEDIKRFVDITTLFDIKNTDSLHHFFNRVNGAKKKNISSEEFKNFIDLFKYSSSENLFEEAKKQNSSVVQYLTKEKENFLSIKQKIEDYIITDSSDFYMGQTALDIYHNYKNYLLENPTEIETTLANISSFNIQSPEEYANKKQVIEKFSKFFETREEEIKFFAENNIKLDDSKEDNKHIENCFTILNSVYDDKHPEISKKRVEYFATSRFLVKSQNKLSELLIKLPDDKRRKEILSLIADKKIPSIKALSIYFEKYNTSKDGAKNLLKFLKNIPDGYNFTSGMDSLKSLQLQLNQLNIPIEINSETINAIDLSSCNTEEELGIEELNTLLDKMFKTNNDENFISVISSKIEEKEPEYNTYRIAQELASKITKSQESYQNISRLLKIRKEDFGLPYNCSHYIYVKAIEKTLPEEFINFVNSDDWIQYSTDKSKTPNLILHARLRAIDRFALNNAETIDELYTNESKEKLKSLFKTVYADKPTYIAGSDFTERIIADFNYDSNIIEAVFSNQGKMITIVPKRGRN